MAFAEDVRFITAVISVGDPPYPLIGRADGRERRRKRRYATNDNFPRPGDDWIAEKNDENDIISY